MGSKRTYKLKKSLLRSSKGRSALRHREKPAKPEIVRKSGLVSEFNNNAKMVSKSLKHGKTLKPFLWSIFSDRYNFFKQAFH